MAPQDPATQQQCGRWVIIATYVLCLGGLPFLAWELLKRGAENHIVVWVIAAVFVMLTVPLSVHDIVQHLLHFAKPTLQKYVVRIMWMVPIYSISSFLSLVLKDSSPYLDVIRDFYECFVIHAFVAFLIAWCGSEDQLASKLRQKPPSKGAHLWPMSCCLPRWRLGRDFLWRCKWGTLQYIVVKTTCAIATLIMQALDVYGEGEVFSLTHGYLYVSLLSAVSQTYAIYCLVLFYHAMSGDLAPMNPVPKFLTVKAVVFATWAQSVAVAAAVQLGLIAPFITAQYSEEDIAKGIQNFAICVEMFIAALLHRRIFSFRQYSADSGAGEYSYESLARLGVLPQGGGQGDHMGFGRGQPIPGVLRRGISPAVARLAMDSSGSSIGSDGGGGMLCCAQTHPALMLRGGGAGTVRRGASCKTRAARPARQLTRRRWCRLGRPRPLVLPWATPPRAPSCVPSSRAPSPWTSSQTLVAQCPGRTARPCATTTTRTLGSSRQGPRASQSPSATPLPPPPWPARSVWGRSRLALTCGDGPKPPCPCSQPQTRPMERRRWVGTLCC